MSNYQNQTNVLKICKEMKSHKGKYLIIHYACESFYENTQQSKRITSIAIRKLIDGQTDSFSIFKTT